MLIAEIPYPKELQTQTVALSDAISLAYTDIGKGPPLLFIHGLGSSFLAWSKNIPFLSKHFRCIALDLPGYGKSSKLGFRVNLSFYAQLIDDFLSVLQLHSCYLAGHSMGGQVAIHTALKYPLKIEKLILIAPAGIETFNKEEENELNSWFELNKVYKANSEIIAQQVKANFFHFPEDANSYLQVRLQYKLCEDYIYFCQAASDCVKAMLNEPVKSDLQNLTVPTTILFGKEDAYIPNRQLHPKWNLQELLEEAIVKIPHASYTLFDSCGHILQWEQSERTNAHITEFLVSKRT